MTETVFCYSCRVHHPKAEMRLFRTRRGLRWRCVHSIVASTRSTAERDAFGQRQSLINREEARRQAQYARRLQALALAD